MQIYPAIDLKNGRTVRLYQGRFDKVTQYDADPLELAQRYADAGASRLHLVDLDGAREGSFANLGVIENIADRLAIPVQCGGGIRSTKDLRRLYDAGVTTAVVGSVCVRQPQMFLQWLDDYGDHRLIAALDVRASGDEYFPAVAGWEQTAASDLWQTLDPLVAGGLTQLLCTDIGRDGTLNGPNQDLYTAVCRRFPQLRVQASGGVGSLQHLSELPATGVSGVVVGKALLDGRIAVADALEIGQ